MTIHEFGKENDRIIVLIHPSAVMWDYFEALIPLLKDDFHLIVPALPGYDPDKKENFTSVEAIASELEEWLLENGYKSITCIYGCSMGGSIVIKMLADNTVKIHSAVIDGGITPYRLPWIITRFIAIKDFLLIYTGKLGGIRLLQKAFATDKLSDEDIRYAAKVLKMMSAKTIWRTFESCNNYTMPERIHTDCKRILYLYAKNEAKERKKDIAYMKEGFPQSVLKEIENIGHGGLAVFRPQQLADEIKGIIK